MKKVLVTAIMCIGMVITACGSSKDGNLANGNGTNGNDKTGAVSFVGDFSADDFENAQTSVENMVIGWNIGNSLDSYMAGAEGKKPKEIETMWGNPVTDSKLIKALKEEGFNAIRIPITWLQNVDENGKINEEWLVRVQEVVEYVLEEDMYCIINVHHDTGGGEEAWLRADLDNYNEISERYADLWKQIAEYFKGYNDHLLFESFNEILDAKSNWGGSSADSYAAVNFLNQVFVDTVRATGGNNAYRNIICNTYGASSANSQVSGFSVPEDSAENHLISEVHIYDPGEFCNAQRADWTEDDKYVLDTIFERLNEKIIQAQGTPMIIGEFGAKNADNEEARAEYAAYFIKKAAEYKITCFWWDDGHDESMGIINRRNFIVTMPVLCKSMVEAANE